MIDSIREEAEGDRPRMLDLWTEAWTAFLPEIDFEARRPWFTAHLDGLKQEGASLFVVTDPAGAICGFVTIDPGRQDMDQLVTAISVQRQGVGRRLLRFAKDRSPEGLSLTVNANNVRAIDLYRSEGFVIVGHGTSSRSGLPVLSMRWTASHTA